MEKPDIKVLRDFRPTSGYRRWGVVALNNSGKLLFATSLVGVACFGAALYPTMSVNVIDAEIKTPSVVEAVKAEPDVGASYQIKSPSAPAVEPESATNNKDLLPNDPRSVVDHAGSASKTSGDTELGSLDLSDLANAIDNLGLRLEEAEQRLAATSSANPEEAEPTPEASTEKSLDGSRSGTLLPTDFEQKIVDEADRLIYRSLQERLSEAEASADTKKIELAEKELKMFKSTLETLIEFRVVSDKKTKSGFWRSRQTDPDNKQYFLVVEAVVDGETVNWAIKDTDTAAIRSVSSFGLGVEESTFAEFAADFQDDGRVNSAIVGIKPVGRIQPVWSVKTNGVTIAGVK
jgi:hypothetical protein